MGGNSGGIRTQTEKLRQEQKAAAALPQTNDQKARQALASFNVKDAQNGKFKLLNFTKGENGQGSNFLFEQNGFKFGAGVFASQEAAAQKFDPTKPFGIRGGGETPQIYQPGTGAIFSIGNPIVAEDPTQKVESISPNGAANQPLPRIPFGIGGTGKISGTAAARALSTQAVNKARNPNLLRPMLAGY